MSDQNPHQDPTAVSGGIEGFAAVLLKAAAYVAVVIVLLPVAVPLMVAGIGGHKLAKRHSYWITHKWHPLVNVITIGIVAIVLAWEAAQLVPWLVSGQAEALLARDGWFELMLATALPWLIVNLVLGILLLPVAWSIQRRRIADKVRLRTIPNVQAQEDIEAARKRAADVVTARKIGVTLNPQTGAVSGGGGKQIAAPLPVRDRHAIGVVTRHTIRTTGDKMVDRRRISDWMDLSGRYITLPQSAGALRALLLAESGSGKTVLILDLILAALKAGWPVVFIDAKGDPDDAKNITRLAQDQGSSAVIADRWNLFTGTAAQITDKLMRLLPPPDGANQHYLDETRGVLQVIQANSPLGGMRDLFERLTAPEQHVRDQVQLDMVTKPIDREQTPRAQRVRDTLLVALSPLESYLSAKRGWSYNDRPADLTVVPLVPVDGAQRRLGDLLLMDLRNHLADRLKSGDKSPALVIVDEFAQLVTDDSDPADTAAALFETARSAGMGLLLAVQSKAGLSTDEIKSRRVLGSGAALIAGRSKDPEDTVKLAGTVMRMEASGAATGEELRSGRAQHTYVIPPNDVRQAAVGSFWIVQSGAFAAFRVLPNPSPSSQNRDDAAYENMTGEGVDGADERAAPNTTADA